MPKRPRPRGDPKVLPMKHSLFVLLLMAAMLWPRPSIGRDLHAFWDGRCRECHGDAGEFARRTLRVERERLLGVHHVDDLELFLRNHYLPDELVAPVTAMLKAQVETAPLFKPRCAGCHGTAAEFVRQSLTVRNGVLVGKHSGRAVDETLRKHGGLTPAEVPEMVRTLQRVVGEVSAPD